MEIEITSALFKELMDGLQYFKHYDLERFKMFLDSIGIGRNEIEIFLVMAIGYGTAVKQHWYTNLKWGVTRTVEEFTGITFIMDKIASIPLKKNKFNRVFFSTMKIIEDSVLDFFCVPQIKSIYKDIKDKRRAKRQAQQKKNEINKIKKINQNKEKKKILDSKKKFEAFNKLKLKVRKMAPKDTVAKLEEYKQIEIYLLKQFDYIFDYLSLHEYPEIIGKHKRFGTNTVKELEVKYMKYFRAIASKELILMINKRFDTQESFEIYMKIYLKGKLSKFELASGNPDIDVDDEIISELNRAINSEPENDLEALLNGNIELT